MNWAEIWPQVVAGILVAGLTALSVFLWRRLTSVRRQLGESKSLARRLKAIGLTNFYETRDDYAKYRGTPRLADYLALAQHRIMVAGYWLAQGSEMEGVTADLRRLLEQRAGLRITIVLLDPDASYIPAVADQLKLDPAAVIARARDSMRGLTELRSSLAQDTRDRLDLRLHSSIPFSSLIVLDPDNENDARVQFDFKIAGNSRSNSVGFEIRSTTSRAGANLIRSCEDICAEAKSVPDMGSQGVG